MSDSPPPQKNKRKRPFLRFLRRAFLTVVVLILLIVAAGFVFRDQIGAELKSRLDQQLDQRGIYVEYNASDFAPLSGLTLSDVKVFRDASRAATAITLSEARLRFDPLGIIRGKSAASVQIATEEAGLVLSDETGDYAINQLDAELSIDRNGTDINKLAGNFRDLNFDVDGKLGWGSEESTPAEDPVPETPEIDPTKRVIDLSGVTRYLDYIPDTPDGEADLKLKLNKEGAEPIELSGSLNGEKVNWKALSAQDVALEFGLAADENGTLQLDLPKVSLTLDERNLDASGQLDLGTKLLTLESLKTGLNPASLLPIFPENKKPSLPSLPEYEFNAKGSLNLANILGSELSGDLKIAGPADIPMGDRAPLKVSALASPFLWRDGSIQLESLTAKLGENQQLALTTQTTIRLPQAPQEPESTEKVGTQIEIASLKLDRSSQSLTASGNVDLGQGVLTLASLESGVDIGGLLTDLGFADPISERAQFSSPPQITAKGTLPFASPAASADLSGTVQAAAIAVPAGENRVAKLSDLSTQYQLAGGMLGLAAFETGVFGGKIVMPNMKLGITQKPVTLDGRIQFEALSLEEITAFANAEKRRTGQLDGFFEGNGQPDLATLTGNGQVQITGAEFGTVPIFRTLRPLLSAITLTNWKGETEGANMSSTFTFNQGEMKSDDIAVKGDFYEIHADTTVNFAERTLEADGKVSTSGATKVITQVVGKALEVEASGTFDDFSWKLKNAPGLGTVSDLTGLSKDLLGNTLGAAASGGGDITGALVNGVKDTLTSGEPVKGATKMAEDTLKGVSDVGKKLFGLGKKDEEKAKEEEKPAEGQPAPETETGETGN